MILYVCVLQIRRLISSCLSKLYGKGDQLPLFSRVSSLQLFLGTKEAFGAQTSEDVRLGGLELMNTLYYSHGKSLTVGVLETSLIASKYCSRSCSTTTRQAGLKLLAATVEGVGFQHREATQVQSNALKCIEKIVKEKDLPDSVKLGISDVLRAIALAVPAESWLDGSLSVLSVQNLCLSGLKDLSSTVRAAYARALGELVASVYQGASRSGGDGTKEKKIVDDTMESCLIAPLAEFLVTEDRNSSIALSQAWVHFLMRLQVSEGFEDATLLELVKGPLVSVRVASTTSNHINIERGPFGPDLGLGASISSGERPFSQACVTYIIRCGIIEQMGEHGQRELLRILSSGMVHGFQDFSASLIMTQLDVISNLVETLGEIGDEISESLEHVLGHCFASSSAAVRWHAGSTLAKLSISEPGRAAHLFRSALNSLKNAADALVEASSSISDKSRVSQGIPRWPGSNKFSKEINHLHGWAVASACLVAAMPMLPLGIPSHYPRITSQICAALIESPRSEHPGGLRAELEAGYILLGSLCKNARQSMQALYKDHLFKLWLPVFAETSLENFRAIISKKDVSSVYYINSFSFFVSKYNCLITQEQEMSAELWWRSEALHALGAYFSQSEISSEDKAALCGFLPSMVEILVETKNLSDPTSISSRGGYTQIQATASLFQMRLLRLLLLLPKQFWGDHLHTTLSNICIAGMTSSGLSVLSVVGLQGFLTNILDLEEPTTRDKFFSNDIFERDLLLFCGASGGVERELWSLRVSPSAQTYSQSLSLSEALLLVRAQVLAKTLELAESSTVKTVIQKLAGMTSAVCKDKTGTKKLCLMLLEAAPFIIMTKQTSYENHLSQDTVEIIENLASEVSFYSSHGFWVQATASNLYFALSRLSEIQHSQSLLSSICSKAISTPSLDQRASYVLSIGSISRAIGGICMTSMLPHVVETLLALAKASPSSILSFIAHALTITSLSSGPGFLPFVRKTLEVTQGLLLDENIYSTPGLLPSIGQLGNAMVACLGPDYVLGSQSYDICRSIVSEMRAPGSSCVRLKEDILAGALQSVLYIQMLVLFAPKASKTADHVSILVETLPSKQPYLRRAAADTLRHLAEKETAQVLVEHIEESLFAAFDGETDTITAEQLKGSLNVLLRNGAPKEPSRWINLLGRVATSSVGPDRIASDINMMESENEQEADENHKEPRNCDIQNSRISFHPRLCTRLLAADGLNRVPHLAIESDKHHGDAMYAADHPGNWLASCAEILVENGFKMASGDVDVLRSRGVTLLLETLNALGDSKDPLMPDQLLMCQYQAQFVSALRGSLSKDASPALYVAGCALVASFLEKGIASSENSVMEKILALLCEPLTLWSSGSPDPTQNAYAEWVSAGARAALLESHAICATLHVDSETSRGLQYCDIVSRAHGPFYTILVECWIGFLEDMLILMQNNDDVNMKYTLRLYGRLGAAKSPTMSQAKCGIEKIVRSGWPSILDAATFVMSRDRTVSHGNSGKSRYLLLFDIAIGCTSLQNDYKSYQTILKALERLTRQKYTKEDWLNDAMMNKAVVITQHIMRATSTSKIEHHDLCDTGARVIQNIMECTSLKHQPGDIALRIPWAMECIECVKSASPTCLENSLHTLRLVLTNLISQSAPIEEISLCLYHSMKCGFELSMNGKSEKGTSLAFMHIIETAKIAAIKNSTLSTVSAMDPGIPSIEEILTLAASEMCDIITSDTGEHIEYMLRVILVLGAMATHTHNGVACQEDTYSASPCQIKCLRCLEECMSSKNQETKVFQTIEEWLCDSPPQPWVMLCGSVIYPRAMKRLYKYSLTPLKELSRNETEIIQTLIHICRYFGTMHGEFGHRCLQSMLPVIVRIAGYEHDKHISASCVACLLSLAKSQSSAESFKTIIAGLPEKDRLSLHTVLASGGTPQAMSSREATQHGTDALFATKGLQSLDLSRFT